MSAAPATPADATAASDIAAAIREAPFVRVVAAANGDSLAASGVLARACRESSIPFQVRIDPVPAPAPGEGDDLVVGVGAAGGDIALPSAEVASLVAAAVARELGVAPDPMLALAGVASAGRSPDVGDAASLLDAARERTTVERRPGVATPTAELADGVAHSMLVHAPVSGDSEAATAALSTLGIPSPPGDEGRRRLASWLAIKATTSSARAAEAVERALRPHATPEASFATIEGFGDALDAVARERPGTGVALAIRDDDSLRTAVLDAWRDHARATHGAVTAAATGRYDGVLVARVDAGDPGRLGTVARLYRDYRSPEPVVIAVGNDAAAAASVDDARLDDAMREAARSVDGDGSSAGGARRAAARVDGLEVSRFITAFREAL
ncbi:MAG: exonuclease RecJ [Haloplanus sp.]